MNKWWLRPWRWLWASPVTALGGMFACLPHGGQRRFHSGTVEVFGGSVGKWLDHLPAACRVEALTLGHVIVARDEATLMRWRKHEHAHVRQFECWGLAFLPAYGLASLWAWGRGGCAYQDNWFERRAYAACDPREPHPTQRVVLSGPVRSD